MYMNGPEVVICSSVDNTRTHACTHARAHTHTHRQHTHVHTHKQTHTQTHTHTQLIRGNSLAGPGAAVPTAVQHPPPAAELWQILPAQLFCLWWHQHGDPSLWHTAALRRQYVGRTGNVVLRRSFIISKQHAECRMLLFAFTFIYLKKLQLALLTNVIENGYTKIPQLQWVRLLHHLKGLTQCNIRVWALLEGLLPTWQNLIVISSPDVTYLCLCV